MQSVAFNDGKDETILSHAKYAKQLISCDTGIGIQVLNFRVIKTIHSVVDKARTGLSFD